MIEKFKLKDDDTNSEKKSPTFIKSNPFRMNSIRLNDSFFEPPTPNSQNRTTGFFPMLFTRQIKEEEEEGELFIENQ